MLLARTDDMQLFGYTPRGHRRGRKQAVGLTLRVRARGKWRWFEIQSYWPRRDLVMGRGTVSFQAASWLTSAKTNKRVTVKVFLRLKLGLGGPQPRSETWGWADADEWFRRGDE